MNEKIKIEVLQEFINSHKVVFASAYGKVNKRLCITMYGVYEVYHNNMLVFESKSACDALNNYNNIN